MKIVEKSRFYRKPLSPTRRELSHPSEILALKSVRWSHQRLKSKQSQMTMKTNLWRLCITNRELKLQSKVLYK